jgi:hypothetical protein
MRRASSLSAAIRAPSSSWSQAVGDGLDGVGLDGRSGGSRNRFICIAALHVRRRLDMPALESVDDLAQLEQITELAESRWVDAGGGARRWVGVVRTSPIGPWCRNEGSAAVWQDEEDEQHAASLNAADHSQLPALECVTLPDDRHIIWMIAEMGSLSTLPSIESITTAWWRVAARIADKRLLKLIRAFLNAGVMEKRAAHPQIQPLSHQKTSGATVFRSDTV